MPAGHLAYNFRRRLIVAAFVGDISRRRLGGALHNDALYALVDGAARVVLVQFLAPHASQFAAAWRSQPKWVVSRSLKSVGPNATLVADDVEAVMRGLKAQLVGEIEVGGPDLARSLTDLRLIDEYRLYFRPVVLGRGKPFFAGPRPPLRLVASDLIGEDAIRLTYVPA
jgi:riboflavin biosynthesis pyrimidine reductase